MARKAAWEDLADSDLGPYAKPRGTRWGRVLAGLLLVGAATFVAGYYVPLYRAQQRLGEQYRTLSEQSQALSQSASAARESLKATTEERDQLRAEQDQKDNATHDAASQRERAGAAVSSKLDKLIKKNGVVVVATDNALVVAVDSALLFLPQRLDLTSTAPALLCEILKAADAKSLEVSGVLAQGASAPAALGKSFPSSWALSAARAAAVAESAANKCGFSAAQLSATGNADHDRFGAALASTKLAADHVELVLDLQH
jgi:flagellar motor protein MotB